MKLIVICPIALAMNAVNTSETSISIYQTTNRNIPEGSHQTRGRKNLKSHQTGTDDPFVVVITALKSMRRYVYLHISAYHNEIVPERSLI
jgi:hypothetical protein